MTFWPLTNSDFSTDQTLHQFHDLDTELDPHRIMGGFHGAIAAGVVCQQGTLTIQGHLVPSPFLELACAPIIETRLLKLAMSLFDFSPWMSLGTFSIFLLLGPLSFFCSVALVYRIIMAAVRHLLICIFLLMLKATSNRIMISLKCFKYGFLLKC